MNGILSQLNADSGLPIALANGFNVSVDFLLERNEVGKEQSAMRALYIALMYKIHQGYTLEQILEVCNPDPITAGIMEEAYRKLVRRYKEKAA